MKIDFFFADQEKIVLFFAKSRTAFKLILDSSKSDSESKAAAAAQAAQVTVHYILLFVCVGWAEGYRENRIKRRLMLPVWRLML